MRRRRRVAISQREVELDSVESKQGESTSIAIVKRCRPGERTASSVVVVVVVVVVEDGTQSTRRRRRRAVVAVDTTINYDR